MSQFIKHIFAYTETTKYIAYPAFISLNKNDKGEYELIARSRDKSEGAQADLSIPRDQLRSLANAILDEIEDTSGKN